MNPAIQGASVRLQRPKDEQPPSETYLTPTWVFPAWLRASGWRPLRPGPIVDPCACGWGGYSVGAQVAKALDLDADLSDINPRGGAVAHADLLTRDYRHAGAIVTNPPFTLASKLLALGLEQCGEVVLLLTTSAMFDGQRWEDLWGVGRFASPARLGFGLLPEHVEAERLAEPRTDSITGWGLPEDGRHHAIGVWRRGWGAGDYVGWKILRGAQDIAAGDEWRRAAMDTDEGAPVLRAAGGVQMGLF